ncbi:MAG TPA: metallopeptidase TldD-related protein [Terracidiphilus sp.]|nr:metallopeptidase TldD-related protein [Terracidiphilus sp.]
MIHRRVPALLASAILFAASASAFSQCEPSTCAGTLADAQRDPILKAMLDEMDRSKSGLELKGFQKPYFLEYRIEDVDVFRTHAEFGASEGSSRTHERVARVTVRVGDYKTDSSGSRGDGQLEFAALGDDPIAVRSALWAATDLAYKIALDAYARKQAELKQVQTPPQADDFSHEKPVIALAAPASLNVDEAAWTQRVATDSGLYRTDPAVSASAQNVQYSLASFEARATTTWIVNSEGTIVRKSASICQESFGVGAQAADGMHLDRSYGTSGLSVADLDSPEAFRKHAVALIASLADLRKAPLVEEEYHGPLLLSADAGTDILRSQLGGGLGAARPSLGTEARTTGPFASSYHTRVLPDFMDAVDDPSLKSWDGHSLLGAYAIDDEGVPAQPVKLVDAGRLLNYLIGREPVRDFPQSNGHARASLTGPPHPVLGVLKITAQNGLSDDELESKLLALMKDRGVDSAYYVETMGSGLTPRLLYRVTADGKRQLVRGAVLDDLDQRALRSSIEAAGKDLWVGNYPGEIPETVLAPALLLNDATVKRANEKNEKLPFYPPPGDSDQ